MLIYKIKFMEKIQLLRKNLKPYKKVPGIYKIIINERFYIGSSKNLYNRLCTHIQSMKSQTHHNRTIQNCFNKYGEDNMFFEILETFEDYSESFLIEREKYYMDLLNPDMNHIKDPVVIVRDATYRKRLSEAQKKRFKNKEQHNVKRVYQYDLDGNFLQEWKSASEAARKYGSDYPTLVCNVCRGEHATAYGYR